MRSQGEKKIMIKKIIFALMWFLIIFIVSYVGTGVILVLLILAPETNQVKYEAARAFKDAYMIFFLAGSLFLATLGTVTGILPGTKKPRAKKKTSAKKKARKKK
jgi:ABC-type Fe3+ transport system permease subunit